MKARGARYRVRRSRSSRTQRRARAWPLARPKPARAPRTRITARHAGQRRAAIVTDGGAGVCVPQPCVVSTDCPNDELCDTSQEPFKCVECISTADCPGDFQCDVATRTCVADADAGLDSGRGGRRFCRSGGVSPRGDAAVDATVPTEGADGSGEAPGEDDAGDAAPSGTLDGGSIDTGRPLDGACDCSTVAPVRTWRWPRWGLGVLGAPRSRWREGGRAGVPRAADYICPLRTIFSPLIPLRTFVSPTGAPSM